MRSTCPVVGFSRRVRQNPVDQFDIERVEERAVVEHGFSSYTKRVSRNLAVIQDDIARASPPHGIAATRQGLHDGVEAAGVDRIEPRHSAGKRLHDGPHETARPHDHRRPATWTTENPYAVGSAGVAMDFVRESAGGADDDGILVRLPEANERSLQSNVVSLVQERFIERQIARHSGPNRGHPSRRRENRVVGCSLTHDEPVLHSLPESPSRQFYGSVMTEGSRSIDNPGSGQASGGRPDHHLPPVEPPSAAFLVQLFLAPAIIVGIIVSVWLSFHWLAHLGSDPQALVRTLRRDNEGRWQAALNLANDLRGPGGSTLKTDSRLAEQLGAILDEEVQSGRVGEQSQTLKLYLCRALGEFATPVAAAPLVRRAGDLADAGTAVAAVEALAVLAANLADAGSRFDDPDAVRSVILEASRSEDAALRSRAAFALGVIGGDDAESRLLELSGFGGGGVAAEVSQTLPDLEPGSPESRAADVRYNAATALARLGRDEAYEPLAEMLVLRDPTQQGAAVAASPVEQSLRYKRAMIVKNAIKAVALLVDASDGLPPENIRKLIEDLGKDPVSDVRSSAAELSKKLDRLEASISPSH